MGRNDVFFGEKLIGSILPQIDTGYLATNSKMRAVDGWYNYWSMDDDDNSRIENGSKRMMQVEMQLHLEDIPGSFRLWGDGQQDSAIKMTFWMQWLPVKRCQTVSSSIRHW